MIDFTTYICYYIKNKNITELLGQIYEESYPIAKHLSLGDWQIPNCLLQLDVFFFFLLLFQTMWHSNKTTLVGKNSSTVYVKLSFSFSFLWDRGSLCSPGWPQSCDDLISWASQVLGLEICTATSGENILFLEMNKLGVGDVNKPYIAFS